VVKIMEALDKSDTGLRHLQTISIMQKTAVEERRKVWDSLVDGKNEKSLYAL
jgi:hypothetical protein